MVVDDDDVAARFFQRCLEGAGHEVMCAENGERAREQLEIGEFDVVVSDISMPEMDGIELLREVRRRDLDLPVVLVTGAPNVDSAIQALQFGAIRYLVKPVRAAELCEVVDYAGRVHDLARLKREALWIMGIEARASTDRAGLEASFERALASVGIAYQPIVRWSGRTVYAYEALVRSEAPALSGATEIIDAALRLSQLDKLGRVIRERVANDTASLPAEKTIFVNLHPLELEDPSLYTSENPLAAIANRVVLEITERASLTGVSDLLERFATLRSMGFRLAVDDLGAGYSGLTSFVHVSPEIVKVDMSLVRDVDGDPAKQKLIRSIVGVCRDIGVEVVLEGVESEAEAHALVGLGGDLLQGYFFAAPSRPFPTVPSNRIREHHSQH